MANRWRLFFDKYPLPPMAVGIAGFILGGFVDNARDWALAKAMLTPYLLPLLVVAAAAIWFFYIVFRPPRMEITCDPSRHPFRQEWDDQGGHQILFRIGIKNVSKFTAVSRAQVLLTGSDPFMMHCIPARLLLMNESRSARDFFLPPDATQYVDVLQQSQPNDDLVLWHTVRNQERRISPDNYTITITAYGGNTDAVSRRFTITRQGSVFVLIPQGSGRI